MLTGDTEAPSARSTVIIATLASKERAAGLFRAIRSVQAGNLTPARILVVINGHRYDEGLVRELSATSDFRTIQMDEASLPGALAMGVQSSTTPFFGFLDDDDEYLPGAVDLRTQALDQDPEAAVLVTNGLRRKEGVDSPALANLPAVPADPLRALFQENWLPSCGGFFRRSLLPDGLFSEVPSLLEWTWIAFHLAQAGARVAVLDEPTFRIHSSPGSQSKSPAYVLSHPDTLARMRARCERPDIRAVLTDRLVQSLYAASRSSRSQGRYFSAWEYHLRCLRHPRGWRYWRHTVRLLMPRSVSPTS